MHFGSFNSASNTDIGVPLIGGAELSLMPMLNGFAEVKYAVTDLSYFGIFVGANYMIGK